MSKREIVRRKTDLPSLAMTLRPTESTNCGTKIQQGFKSYLESR